MMKRFWKWLLDVALWRLGWECYIVPEEFRELVRFARKLCDKAEAVADVSGEWKRHQVYAALIKAFPKIRKRHLALAIEVALNVCLRQGYGGPVRRSPQGEGR